MFIRNSAFSGIALSEIASALANSNDDSTSPANKNNAYQPDWHSLQMYQIPGWFRDAKFGIYYHWGLYSVPAYDNEWYSRNMYIKGAAANIYHLQHYGSLSKFGYKDFAPLFKAERFDPEEWAELFKKAGARFAGPVAEHADGFSMWNSNVNEWNAAKIGPKRDLVGEMSHAVRNKGLKFVTSFHHQWRWGWYPTMDMSCDCSNPAYSGLYGPPLPTTAFDYGNPNPKPDEPFCTEWENKVLEVIQQYHPDLIYFDSRMAIIPEQYRLDLISKYYNRQIYWRKPVVLTYKKPDLPDNTAVEDLERGRMASISDRPWMTDDAIDWNSWCNVQNPNYKSTKRLLDELIDIVSKNGCLLLDITPRADGTIPQEVQDRLLEMGAWLHRNGEAIYGSRPWKVFGEGPTQTVGGAFVEEKIKDLTAEDIRFTIKKDALYVMVMGEPHEDILVASLKRTAGMDTRTIREVRLLGEKEKLQWSLSPEGLRIKNPGKLPSPYANAFKITFSQGKT
jgi:alpha-L-fucosidase